MKNNEEIKYPRFISNQPCCDDLFEGHSHTTIANNIAELLIENKNCNIIGIDGSWGSGKSNLVKLVEKSIQNNKENKKKFQFFIYDAWGLQNDAQRRSIMENITSYLINHNSKFNSDYWNKRLVELLTKSRTTGAKITKELNAFVKVSSVNVFLSPLYVKLYNLIPDNLPKYISWIKAIYWPLLIFFSLLVVILLQISEMKKYHQPVTCKTFLHDIFYSYLDYGEDKKNVERAIKYETVFEKEPSSRDFLCWIRDIDSTLKDERLVIVFDNMDRLPAKKVQDLWSAINNFFSGSENNLQNISVIIPFDRLHIKNAFKSENIIKMAGNKQSEEQISYGDDFINKTFNVVFRVSPPTMSNWEDYFNKLWYQSFNNKVDPSVLQIYDLLSTIQTPRKIIAFINEFVAIKKVLNECNEEIPEKYIALFIFGKNIISLNPTSEILNPTYLGALDFLYKPDENLPKYISALYYQLPADKVLDIIYTDQIRKALDNAEPKMLSEIKEFSMFFGFLQHAITRVTNIKHAVLTLNECLKDNSDQENKQRIWDCLYKKVNTTENELEEYQKILLQNITDKKQYLRKIINDFYKNDKFNSILFAKNINELRESGYKVDDCLNPKILEPKDYVTFVQELKDEYGDFKIECDFNKLDEYLSSFDDTNDIKQITALSYMNFGDIAFPKFSDKLQKLIEAHKSNYNNTSILFERLKELHRPTGKVLDDATIINLFAQAKKEDSFYYDLLAMRITRITSYQGSNTNVIDGVIKQNDETIADKVANVIEYYINFGNLLGEIDNLSKYPLYNLVCKGLIKDSKGISSAHISSLLTIYEKIVTKLDVTPEDYISRVNGWKKYLSDEISIENISNIPIKFFEDTKTIDNETTKYCKKIAYDYLHSKNINEWKDSLINGKYEYKLALIIEFDGENLFDAFKTLLIEYAEDKQPNLKKEVCNQICGLAINKKRSLINTFKDVRDAFCNGSAKMTDAKFSFFGKWLFEFANLSEKKESLRTILPTQYNIFSREENIILLMEKEKEIKKMISISGEESDDFKRKIKDLAVNNYKENTQFLEFVKHLGIEFEEETANTES